MVYLIAVIAALIAACLNNRMTPALRKGVLITLGIYVILIIGFRYKVGIDTISYMHVYRQLPPLEDLFSKGTLTKTRFEPGLLLICCICKSFYLDFWAVQMIMATITTGGIFLFLYRYCNNVFIGVLFYFLFQCLYFSTEIIRESAAVAIFLLNYKNLQEKKWLKYYIFSAFSLLFHYSAIIIWFFPFARLLRNNFIFIGSCIIFLAITPLVEKMNELLQIAALSGRINQYVAGAADLNINWRIGELIRAALPAIAVIVANKIRDHKSPFHDMLLLQILFCMGAFAIPLIFSRFSNYTFMFVTAGAANVLTSHSLQSWFKMLFVSFMLLTQSYYYASSYSRWIPYISIFYPEELHFRDNLYRHSFMPWLKLVREAQ